jgi:hypothetical protein
MAGSMDIHMDKDNMGEDIITRYPASHPQLHLKMDHQKMVFCRIQNHHNMVFFYFYTLSYLPLIYAYITSYAKIRVVEWAFVLIA